MFFIKKNIYFYMKFTNKFNDFFIFFHCGAIAKFVTPQVFPAFNLIYPFSPQSTPQEFLIVQVF